MDNVYPIFTSAIVFFLLSGVFASEGTDLMSGIALTSFLLGYLLALGGLMIHMRNQQFSRF